MEIKKSDFIQSLEKGLKVIAIFDADHQKLTVTEVAKAVDLTRANARRILLTLQYLGYVHSDGKYFSLTPKTLTLGYAYLSTLPFEQLAKPYMKRLAEAVNESCSISVMDGPDIVYVARVQTSRIMTIALRVGTRLPIHATSMGRVLLAGMEEEALVKAVSKIDFQRFTEYTITDTEMFLEDIVETRKRGWALVDQELEIGVRSIACPIRDKQNKVLGALNISGHASRVSKEEMLDHFLPALEDTVAQIEVAIHKL